MLARLVSLSLIALALCCGTVRAAVTPLTEKQRTQLADTPSLTRDIDQGGLYPLLQNASEWTPSEQVEGLVPDYTAIYSQPAAYRGEVIRVEGRLASKPELRDKPLSLPGPWDDTLQRWVALPPGQTTPVIVYLVDPVPIEEAPAVGTPVRLLGRFYTVYEQHSREEPPVMTRYLVFVGQRAQVITEAELGDKALAAQPANSGEPAGPRDMMTLAAIIVAAFLFAVWRLRRLAVGTRPLPSQMRRLQEHDDDGDADEEPLPADPEQALETLAQRHASAREAAFSHADDDADPPSGQP